MKDVEPSAKQQIVEKIKSSSNILIIVSKDPSVDDLTAAIGLSALLNKIDKHATSIFSGILPPVLSFLDPTKVFENSVDSLRDFIIALDKEKADHLRYKIDGDMVKIFITPYRTSITSGDLEFSQGDYNVQLVIALGVSSREHLDAAIASHSQVFVDSDVVSLCAGEQSSQLGSVIWRDETASSLSEMIMSISESLKTDKTLLDKQIATALLTGIVASTDRFSNSRTSSKVMTMAAQLMAAGADQQLIATKLREDHEIKQAVVVAESISEVDVEHDQPAESVEVVAPEAPASNIGELDIEHEATNYDIIDQPVIPEVQSQKYASQPVIQAPEPVVPEQAVIEPEIVPVANDFTQPVNEVSNFTQPAEDQQTSDFINNLASAISTAPNLNPTHELVLQPLPETEESTISPEDSDTRQYISSADSSSTLPPEDSNIDIFNNPQPQSMGEASYADNSLSTLPPVSMEQANDFVAAPAQPQEAGEFALPLPPQMPDFSTLPPASVPDFNLPPQSTFVDNSSSTIPPEDSTNPAQFKIPS